MDHVISISQFKDKKLLQRLFDSTAELQVMGTKDYPKPLRHKTLATIFYEPSTRTRLSFETAIQNLGGNLITTENAGDYSSAIKGETLEDTIRTINGYADGVVLRHPEVGAAERAAKVSKVPVINAGDGAGEHPTQALLDAYSINKFHGKIDGLKIGLVGDLLYGRTVHSLMPLLSLYKVEFYLISPPALRMPKEYLKELDAQGIKYHVLDSWQAALPEVDVLYMTRVQKERFATEKEYLAVKDDFILTLDLVKTMKKNAVIMHPLPRVNEITTGVDADPRAKYFEEVRNGLFLRMALLSYIYA